MKGQWESNINVWFPLMYSQKWNCYFQNKIIMFCLPVPTLICERFIYFQDRSAYSATGKYVYWSWEYINCSQTHECGNWDCLRPRPAQFPEKKYINRIFVAVQLRHGFKVSSGMGLPMLHEMSIQRHKISSHPFTPPSLYLCLHIQNLFWKLADNKKCDLSLLYPFPYVVGV